MPRNLTATPVLPTANTAIPADGDGVDSDSVALYAQKMLNEGKYRDGRIANLESLVPASNASNVYSIWVPVRAKVTTEVTAPVDWYMSYSSFASRPFLLSRVTTACDVIFDLSAYLPQQGKILAADVRYRGNTGHGGVLPAVMPVRYLYSQAFDLTSGTDPAVTVLSTISDTSSAANFEKLHLIGGLISAVTIDNTLQYLLRVTSENGAGSVLGAQILGVQLVVSG